MAHTYSKSLILEIEFFSKDYKKTKSPLESCFTIFEETVEFKKVLDNVDFRFALLHVQLIVQDRGVFSSREMVYSYTYGLAKYYM
jgi:lipoprotein NlpI